MDRLKKKVSKPRIVPFTVRERDVLVALVKHIDELEARIKVLETESERNREYALEQVEKL